MTAYVAFLRAVNVGGTGKLPMTELAAIGRVCGFERVRTYIASGNLLFESPRREVEVKTALEERLGAYAGKPVGVLLRTASELLGLARHNPFPEAPGNRVVAFLLNEPPSPGALGEARHLAGERIALGAREIYVHYPDGVGRSRLVIPAVKPGTARNMNTIRRLSELAQAESASI